MPFIWDDENYSLVNKREEYDKRRFCIVRKLFVTREISKSEKYISDNEFSEQTLNEYFEMYGEIESIEILKPSEEENGTKKLKTYITYQHDVFAYAAVLDDRSHRKLHYKYGILPAYTWKQPLQQNSTAENMILEEDFVPPILMLNEDCFEYLFKYLDINSLMNLLEVCKKINILVLKHGFKHIRYFEFLHDDKINLSLVQLRKVLKCIGKHISQLQFTWKIEKKPDRFLDMLSKYIGENIRCACFRITHSNYGHIFHIKQILQNLTSLTLDFKCDDTIIYFDFEFDFHLFQTLCPNLTKLELRSNIELHNYDEPWSKLECLSISRMHCPTVLRAILRQNPQIKTLKFIAFGEDLKKIVGHIPNVQELSIYSHRYENEFADTLIPLITLQYLRKLSLIDVKSKDLNDVLDRLNQFSTLRSLELEVHMSKNSNVVKTRRTQQSIITLAQELSHLEKVCFIGIGLMKSTVVEFIRFASNLKEFHIHLPNLKIKRKLILEIVDALKTSREVATEPLKLFIDEGDADDLEANQQLDIKNYLSISKSCSHYR